MNYRDVRDFLPFHIDGRKDEQRRISYIKNSKKKVVFYGCQYCVGDIFYKFLKKNNVNIDYFCDAKKYFSEKNIINKGEFKYDVFEDIVRNIDNFIIVTGYPKHYIDESILFDKLYEIYSFNIPLFDEEKNINKFYLENIDSLNYLYNNLNDCTSKIIFKECVSWYITRTHMPFTYADISKGLYFLDEFMDWNKKQIVVDAGAYTGDTFNEFMTKKPENADFKYYALEPDAENYKILQHNTSKHENVYVLNCGVYDKRGIVCFDDGNGLGSTITDSAEGNGISKINVDTIDNICKNDNVTFIKMDIEGSELRALKGATEVIKRDKPVLAICVYHKYEDFNYYT